MFHTIVLLMQLKKIYVSTIFFKTNTKKLTLIMLIIQILSLQICDELNNPTVPRVKSWTGKRGAWKCVVSKSTGRMYRVGFL